MVCGITTAPSSSATITSPGKIAQPPQPIGCCQPTKVNPLTEAGAATPAHHTGSLLASTPARSRITPSVTSAATLRFFMRAQRISPNMPALGTPMASATAMTPSGISSIAARVDIGCAQLSGVARSSRTGTKRKVKAGPTMRPPLGTSGFGPFIQQRRMPFFRSIVVIVAVVTLRRISNKASRIVRLAERRSCRHDAEPLVAAAQPSYERYRQKHHPGLAHDLASQKIERAEGEPEEHDRIDDKAEAARSHDGGDQPPSRQRRIDGKIGELRKQKSHCGSEDERRRRQQRRQAAAEEDRQRGHGRAKPALHEVAQHQRNPDHHHA